MKGTSALTRSCRRRYVWTPVLYEKSSKNSSPKRVQVTREFQEIRRSARSRGLARGLSRDGKAGRRNQSNSYAKYPSSPERCREILDKETPPKLHRQLGQL